MPSYFLLIVNLSIYLPALLMLMLLVKLVIFIRHRTHSWRMTHFFYFKSNHILSSRNTQTQTAKKVQNILSQVILTLAILSILVLIVYRLTDLS